uniref:Cell wall integrity and stress response component 2 n=1 Tax=Ciona intestinalis TaxID=7719 RepID=H2Y0N6_CIOIN|nr:cell wall integrity and stress response component 2 [Ciona intestinalis]|eukprot:XP_002127476.1 cell wall integrity and stress response component 2 [Ciona intestinalis]
MLESQSIYKYLYCTLCISCFVTGIITEEIRNLTCGDSPQSLSIYFKHHSKKVRCPAECNLDKCRVTGTHTYTSYSSICCAGIHDGIIYSDEGGLLNVHINPSGGRNYAGTTSNGVKSHSKISWFSEFTLTAEKNSLVQNLIELKTTTAAKTSTTTTAVPTTTTTTPTTTTTTTVPTTTTTTVPTITTTVTKTTKYTTTTIVPTATTLDTRNRPTTKALPKTLSTTTPHTTTTTPALINSIILNPLRQNNTELLQKINKPVKDDTVNFKTDTTEINESFVAGISFHQKLILCISAVFVFAAVVLLVLIKRRHRIRRRMQPEPCVCYVSIDTSKQGLLNDPETCDRDCVVREKLCHDCDAECNASAYSF